jgi:hypothetical protein
VESRIDVRMDGSEIGDVCVSCWVVQSYCDSDSLFRVVDQDSVFAVHLCPHV